VCNGDAFVVHRDLKVSHTPQLQPQLRRLT
jgi:hypothetical protein